MTHTEHCGEAAKAARAGRRRAARRIVLAPARAFVRSSYVGRAVRSGVGGVTASAAVVLETEGEKAVDSVLAGPLPEAVTRLLIERRVVERVVAKFLASGELERMITSVAAAVAGSAAPARAASGWTVVHNPATAEGDLLVSVSATSASNAWAVGSDTDGAALVEHWNGTAWKIATPPSILYPTGIASVSPTNVWVSNGDPGVLQHWNGHVWKWVTLALPSDGCGAVSVIALSAPSGSNVWAAGEQDACGTAVEHWDGAHWTVWDLDNGDDTGSDTTGVATTNASNAWTTGQQCAGAGGCWSVGYPTTARTGPRPVRRGARPTCGR